MLFRSMPGAVIEDGAVVQYAIVAENTVVGKNAVIGEKPENVANRDDWGVTVLGDNLKIGDNTVIENCIVESRDTIRANTTHIGTPENLKIVIEKNERFTL